MSSYTGEHGTFSCKTHLCVAPVFRDGAAHLGGRGRSGDAGEGGPRPGAHAAALARPAAAAAAAAPGRPGSAAAARRAVRLAARRRDARGAARRAFALPGFCTLSCVRVPHTHTRCCWLKWETLQ